MEDNIKDNSVKPRGIWVKPLLVILVISVLSYLLYLTGLVQFFIDEKRLAEFVNALGPWAAVGLIALQTAQVVLAPVPGEMTVLLGGYLFGPTLGTLYSTLGLTIGSFIAFSLSRRFGKPLVERFVNQSLRDRFNFLLHHKGAFIVFLLFLIPNFPKDALCYFLGLGSLSTIEFLLISLVGRLFGTILGTLGGNYLRHAQYRQLFMLAGVTLVILFIVMLYRQKLERFFRKWHVMEYRKKKLLRKKNGE